MHTEDEMVASPEIDIYGIQDSKKRETPGYPVNNDTLAGRKELIDDGSKEQKVD